MPRRVSVLLALVASFALTTVALADPDDLRSLLQRPARANGVVVVPDRFVRSWDPITVFFQAPTGPAKGGPEDHPERVVQLRPAQPGAWTWLDDRTLQFVPGEPWPPLGTLTVEVGGRTTELLARLSPPVESEPSDGAEELDPLQSIVVAFRDPLPADVLRRMTTIELRPLPGLGDGVATVIGPAEIDVKALPVAVNEYEGAGLHRFELRLRSPIPAGQRATVRFRLADDPSEEATTSIAFATREPFRVTRAGCASGTVPVPQNGATFAPEEAIECTDGRAVIVDFSAAPRALGPVEARNLVRFEPSVPDLQFAAYGTRLEVRGRFASETSYTVRIEPSPIVDDAGRPLDLHGTTAFHVWFPADADLLALEVGNALVESRGPKTIPMRARGFERADVRLFRVDPLDRSFWPFPDEPLFVDEDVRPPGPGEQPEPWSQPWSGPDAGTMATYARLLGSPAVSRIVVLPDGAEDGASFGLDLEPLLAEAGRDGKPGVWLVGVRPEDGVAPRRFTRVQITDLSLTTVEEEAGVRFLVTSLATGTPVSGAEIHIDGTSGELTPTFGTLARGTTGADGVFAWRAPGDEGRNATPMRVTVTRGDDVLVLDANRPPDNFQDEHWGGGENWLGWAFDTLSYRRPSADRLCHMFTERPVYRPGEEVHLEGFLRDRLRGRLSAVGGRAGHVAVRGPGDVTYSEDVTTRSSGGFYWKWKSEDPPTGEWLASFDDGTGARCEVPFKIDAYRVPTVQAELDGPDKVGLDRPFEVALSADHYSGGPVVKRPVRWRVSQYPLSFSPKVPEGFVTSSDGRYSGVRRFDSTSAFEQDGFTDDAGHARLALDPTIEPTAQPRTYVIEATVTGDDDQTVTAVQKVQAVPAFAVALKVPRFVEHATVVVPEVLVVGPDGRFLVDQEVTVRLLHREWHSRLQASDFSDGSARYTTDTVDVVQTEVTVRSAAAPLPVTLATPEPGVYVVEVESRDRLGRAQVVQVDLYVAGDGAVAWPKPEAGTFELAPDRASYDPGQTANIVVKSPWQDADGLLVVEGPDRNRYERFVVKDGQAVVKVPVDASFVPRLPVHVVLMRGRLEGAGRGRDDSDLGKPATLASTVWVPVNPKENTVAVKLDVPKKASPGESVKVTVHLRDDDGRPVSGEVALWLVDQAVLALGTERRLDPLPDFITDVSTRVAIFDSRNLVQGRLPFAVMPGGDSPAEDDGNLPPPTVRRDFRSVPYYEPFLAVPVTGDLTVDVKLPDNLTVFAVRAKATSGAERFGAGKSELEVRLPVVIEPVLPRFVRPGDAFIAGATGRVIEGEGGVGQAKLEAPGLVVSTDARQTMTWDLKETARIGFPVAVPVAGAPEVAKIKISATRTADGVGDAFELVLPVVDGQHPRAVSVLGDVAKGKDLVVPALDEPARPGSVHRTWVVSDRGDILRMAGALSWFERYPYGSTEQRVSRARAYVGVGELYEALARDEAKVRTDAAVKDTLAWLPRVVDSRGLVADWPGGAGRVTRTAWTLSFLAEAREAGYVVDKRLEQTLADALKAALRSDYDRFVDGESWAERVFALEALASSGRYDGAYFAELSRQARYVDPEGLAGIVLGGTRGGGAPEQGTLANLAGRLHDAVIVRLWQGREVYGGITGTSRSPLVLPSEARTAARMDRALSRVRPDDTRLALLDEALVTLGGADGWGSTNANAEALLALAERLRSAPKGGGFTVSVTDGTVTGAGSATDSHVAVVSTDVGGAGVLALTDGKAASARVETLYIPAGDGSTSAPVANGLVVEREWLLVNGKAPLVQTAITAGASLRVPLGQVVEEHVRIVVPEDRYYVAVTVPLAAGMEPLNPTLRTAPPEATPRGRDTATPTYVSWRDDHVQYMFETLPKGTYDLYFRERASSVGSFVEPAADAALQYDLSVWGRSAGARVVVER